LRYYRSLSRRCTTCRKSAPIWGDREGSRSFAAFYFKGNNFLAVDAVNAPCEFAMSRMVLSQGKSLDKQKLADESFALKDTII